jgi:hypothetical protein
MKSFLFALVLLSFGAHCQQAVVAEAFRDIAGTPFFPRSYVDVNGTPYLFDDWTVSKIVLYDGREIKEVKTNINLMTNELLYIDEQGKTMVASFKVVKRLEAGARKFVTTPAKNTYCEVMSTEGKAILLKYSKKVVMETKAFNSATIQKNFVSSDSYLLVVGDSVTEVKSANDISEALGSPGSLKEFAKKEKIRPRSVESWIKLVDFFNSI